MTAFKTITDTFVNYFMENIKLDRKLEDIFNQTFPSAPKNSFDDFKSEVLTDRTPFLMVWPAVLTVKLCALTNDQRLAEELELLKYLESIYLFDPKRLGDSNDTPLIQNHIIDSDSSTPTWVFCKVMTTIIKMTHFKKKFLWQILTTLHDQNESFKLFDELICQYCILLFVLLQHNQTKENEILLFQDDMVEYLFQANSENPALYHLSCLSLYCLSDVKFNSYKIEKVTGSGNNEWTIKYEQNKNCLDSLQKAEGEINFSEDRYCFDGSTLDSDGFIKVLSLQVFETADKLLSLKEKITHTIENLPTNLPRLFAKDPQKYIKLFSEIKKSDEFSSILYHNKNLYKHAQTIISELNTKFDTNFLLNDHIQELNKITELQSKKIELYPEVEEALINAVDELKMLRKKFEEKKGTIFLTPHNSIRIFNEELNDSDFPLLKLIDPQQIFFKKMNAKIKEDEATEEDNLLLIGNGQRDLRRRILPILKLHLEGTPWGRSVNGTDLWDVIKAKYKNRKK